MPRDALLAALFLLLLRGGLGGGCVPGLPPAPGHEQRGFRLPALHAEPDPVAGGRIVDAHGREVLLRGVNVNAFAEYWAYDPELFTTYPLREDDADRIAALGWNAVRLLLSWSRVEPEPGVYDDAYLDVIADAVRLLESRGIYTIVDLHQDAWGPSLAARPDEVCAPNSPPAFGWDGAPEWATLDGGVERCALGGLRELSPAVVTAFQAFWADAPGPGGVGIRTRYVRMLGHVASRLAHLDAVAGYDVMNEPNAIFLAPGVREALSAFYSEAFVAIRAAEAALGAPRRLFVFEPAITWADFGVGAPLPFGGDDQMVYSPHIYQGGISGIPLSEAVFQQARDEAAVFGGVPVLSGEWGGDPRRAANPADGYFDQHQDFQDLFRIGATLWTWREACGDPHKAGDARAGRVPYVWGLFEVDCARNEVLGVREPLAAALLRPLLRAAPGPIGQVAYDDAARRYEARGDSARAGQSLLLFAPSDERGRPPRVRAQGLLGVQRVPARGGHWFVVGFARGGAWQIALEPR